MNDQNLDVNLIIQSFQEKIGQLITELVVKEAMIKHMQAQLSQSVQIQETKKEK